MEINCNCSRCGTILEEDKIEKGYNNIDLHLNCPFCSKQIDRLEDEVESLKDTITDLEKQIEELENEN